jgi:hypothetical protein
MSDSPPAGSPRDLLLNFGTLDKNHGSGTTEIDFRAFPRGTVPTSSGTLVVDSQDASQDDEDRANLNQEEAEAEQQGQALPPCILEEVETEPITTSDGVLIFAGALNTCPDDTTINGSSNVFDGDPAGGGGIVPLSEGDQECADSSTCEIFYGALDPNGTSTTNYYQQLNFTYVGPNVGVQSYTQSEPARVGFPVEEGFIVG